VFDKIILDTFPCYMLFFEPRSSGFSRAGGSRLNDSIRKYVYCILYAQAETRAPILDSGSSNDAQKKYIKLIEDSINLPPNIAASNKEVLRCSCSSTC
jgi:hypothetical protein